MHNLKMLIFFGILDEIRTKYFLLPKFGDPFLKFGDPQKGRDPQFENR